MPIAAAAEPAPPPRRNKLRKRDSANISRPRRRTPSEPSASANPSLDQPRDDLVAPLPSADSTLPAAPDLARKHLRSQTFDSSSIHEQLQVANARYSLREKPSLELLGQRWDSAAILHNFDTILQQPAPSTAPRLPHQHSDLTAAHPTHPATARANTADIVANPDVRLSESLAATGRRMEDIPQSRGPAAARNPASRLSDEAKESKLKKKSGFSKFMNELVGSPRRPAISAPENPVHVTHVGYDQETGEFTVRSRLGVLSQALIVHSTAGSLGRALLTRSLGAGSSQGMAAHAAG